MIGISSECLALICACCSLFHRWSDSSAEENGISTSASLITRLEDQLLQLPTSLKSDAKIASISDVTAIIRRTTAAVIGPHLDFNSSRQTQTLTPESSIPQLLFKADLALRHVPHLPTDLDLANWTFVAPSASSPINHPDISLSVCESLLPDSTETALSLFTRQVSALGFSGLEEQFDQGVNEISRIGQTLSGIDVLRLFRCLSALQWERGNRVGAMSGLARGLYRSVLDSNASDKVTHARQCLLNSALALQLFRFLETPSAVSDDDSATKTTVCREIFDACAAEMAVTDNNDKSVSQFEPVTRFPSLNGSY